MIQDDGGLAKRFNLDKYGTMEPWPFDGRDCMTLRSTSPTRRGNPSSLWPKSYGESMPITTLAVLRDIISGHGGSTQAVFALQLHHWAGFCSVQLTTHSRDFLFAGSHLSEYSVYSNGSIVRSEAPEEHKA
ncbi:hypothetical protein PM082_014958 [Marasmius tenuissimus]|nr:hypothetical protein PM082_014958 [Marasmius tenuissimus]